MLDMHKLKLKYRELSSQYAENLMQPVFQTSKRSYINQDGSPKSGDPISSLDNMMKSARSFTNKDMNTSVR